MSNLAVEPPKNIGINKRDIKLMENKKSLHGSMYALNLANWKIIKIDIEIYLKTRLIWLFKFFVNILILFDEKLVNSLYICDNYQGFNNLSIHNHYSLFLIDKSLDWLRKTKQFIWLDLIIAYHRIWIYEKNK